MGAQLSTIPTPLAGLLVLERHPIGDSRGSFERVFCDQELAGWLDGGTIRQASRSRTARPGTVRGLHFQYAPHAESKIVICLHGSVFDVAVDLRRNSPTFLQWHGETLSDENHRGLLIPTGFAHGFQTLAADCELLYFMDTPYVPGAEGGLHPEDPRLAIAWPLPIAELSARDAGHPRLTPAFAGFER
jgi:dTDP-4-dehydrorhamnose 3,5-epimerase